MHELEPEYREIELPRERHGYKLPSLVRDPTTKEEKDLFLPKYVTVSWMSIYNGLCEVQCHPSRVDQFKENQEKIEKEVEWLT